MHQWHVYQEFEEASQAAADFLAQRIINAIEHKGCCHVILPGGNTPTRCLAYLAGKALPWDKVHWYLGDERCYPRQHEARNDVMLYQHFWDRISQTHIHTIPAELGAESGAAAYRDVIDTVDEFDIAFLGLGEDGHTASLFPDNEALDDLHSVVAVHNSPKPPADRVSLGIGTLRKAQMRLILASGSSKAAVVARIKAGEDLPVNTIGNIHWYVDEAAVSASEV
ncbi:MAG: 6-phosphogluconolactonase [Thioalkalispiraceae bacterium]|jgi:6-phosphogluconolactonase